MLKKIISFIKNKFWIKIVISAFVISIISISLFLFLNNNKERLNNYIVKPLSYNELSEERKDNYDKFKIYHAAITDRKTGTEPFNSGDTSNDQGIDVSGTDNYVRTFDYIKYTIELGIDTNENQSGIVTSNGGVIKVQAKLPNQGNPTLMKWVEDSWMNNEQNSVTISEDGTILYAEYVASENTSLTETLQQLSFTIKVDGYKKDISPEMAPVFEFWMEGNKPDNEESNVESITISDNKQIIISGKPTIDAKIIQTSEYFKAERTINNVSYRGRYDALGLSLSIAQTDDNIPDFRGVEYPSGKITIKAKVIYQYKNVNDNAWTTLNENTANAINKINGFQITAYSINTICNSSFVHSADCAVGALPVGKYNGLKNRSVLDTGDFNLNLNNDEITFTFENYKFNGTFPNNSYYGSSPINNNKYGYFATTAMEFFMPFYDAFNEEISYDYQTIVRIISADYKDTKGNQINISNGSNISIQDAYVNNNSTAIAGHNYVGTTASTRFEILSNEFMSNGGTVANVDYALSKPYTDGNGVILKGQKYYVRSYSRLMDSPFYGGMDNLIVWNPNLTSIIKFDNGSWFKVLSTDKNANFNNIKIYFGIYKDSNDPSKVPETDYEISNAKLESFEWYETYEEAIEHGKISGAYLMDKDYRGKYTVSCIIRQQVIDNAENIGKTIAFRHRLYYYGNEDSRTTGIKVYKQYANTQYIPTKYTDGSISSINSPYQAGDTVLIAGVRSSIQTAVLDKQSNETSSAYFDIQDNEINVIVTPSITDNNTNEDKYIDKVTIKSTLPSGLTYIQGSANKEPISIEYLDDKSVLTWEYENYQVNHDAPEYPKITYKVSIASSIENNADKTIESVIITNEDLSDEKIYRTGKCGLMISNLSGISSQKTIDKSYVDKNESFTVTTTISNNSPTDIIDVKTFEILPKSGDENLSKFSGTYTTKITSLIDGQKIYYTTNNINNIGVTLDKYGNKTVDTVDLDNDSRWTRANVNDIIPNNATAIASTIDSIEKNNSKSFKYLIEPVGNKQKDQYVFVMNTSNEVFSTTIHTNKVLAQVKSYTVIANHYLQNTTTKITDSVTQTYGYGDSYNTEQADVNYNKYELVSTPSNASGTIKSNVIVNYYYKLKQYNLTVHHYLEDSTTELAQSEMISKIYDDDYVTTKSSQVDYNKYELVSTPSNASGTITGDITVIYYYRLKNYTVTTHHYIENTTTKLVDDEINTYKYEDEYTTSPSNNINNYELVGIPNNSSGTIKEDVVVTYFYKLKTATITINHLEADTNNVLAPSETSIINYTMPYSSDVSNKVPKNYIFVSKTDNYAGIVDKDEIIINYYYTKSEYSGDISINKNGTDEITAKDEPLEYNISFIAKAKTFIGNGIIEIIDQLPYEIDTEKSDIDDGIYNQKDKTITWIINWNDINTYDGESNKEINKTIKIVYTEIKGTDRVLINKVTGKLTLDEKEITPVESLSLTSVKIPGKIITKYIDIDTNEEIADDIISTDLVGNIYSSEQKDILGYNLIEKPSSEIINYSEEDTILIYKYQKKKYNILTRILGIGGNIEGDEIVFYDDDSTKDKIKIVADIGYTIDKVKINGKEIEIDKNLTNLIIDNFKNVKEDKYVEVSFKVFEVEAPNTMSGIKKISIILGCIFILSGIIIFLKTKNKIKINKK